jgi:3-dehydroquinate dehydratase-1
MLKIGKTELGGIPRVAISISDREDNKSIPRGLIDILEIRVDQFKKTYPGYINDVIKERRKIGIPLLLTVRSRKEGGEKDILNHLKLRIFLENIPWVDAVDIELESPILPEVVKAAKKDKKTVIVSWHNLKTTPNDKILKGILNKAKRSGADIIKIACQANKKEDLIRLTRFTIDNKSKNIITISLGVMGSISRLFFPDIGSLLTFAYLNNPSGPGQMPLSRLREHLRLYYPA